MKLCSIQIKATCQKVHMIKSHKPAHKRRVFYSLTSERYRIHVSHCWLRHTCWDTLEKTSFHLLGSSQHQRLCILLPFHPSPQTLSTGIPVPGSSAAFGYSSSVDVPMPVRTQNQSKLLACWATCLPVFSIHSIIRGRWHLKLCISWCFIIDCHKHCCSHCIGKTALGSCWETSFFFVWLVVSLFVFLLGPVSSPRFFLIEGRVNTWLPLLLVGSVNSHMILRSHTKLFQLPYIQSRKGSGLHSNMKERIIS